MGGAAPGGLSRSLAGEQGSRGTAVPSIPPEGWCRAEGKSLLADGCGIPTCLCSREVSREPRTLALHQAEL